MIKLYYMNGAIFYDYKKLDDLIPELQSLIESGSMKCSLPLMQKYLILKKEGRI